jgi:hypothetical protein
MQGRPEHARIPRAVRDDDLTDGIAVHNEKV